MEFTKELLEKAKTAESAEKLLELAKAEGMELTAEDAEKAFSELHKSGELADEELDNVSGGGCSKAKPSPDGAAASSNAVVFLYEVNQKVEVIGFNGTTRATVISREPRRDGDYYYPYYEVDYGPRFANQFVKQSEIEWQ